MKEVKVRFSPKAEKVYQKLKKSKLKEDQLLFDAINYKVELLKQDFQLGDKIKRKQIPKGFDNLFRITLPCFWRLLYTLKNDELTIVAFVIDILNHKNYENFMNY